MTKSGNLTMQELVDQLVIHTADYNRLLSSSVVSVQEFTRCKQRLAEIHAAIKAASEREGNRMQHIKPNFPAGQQATPLNEMN